MRAVGCTARLKLHESVSVREQERSNIPATTYLRFEENWGKLSRCFMTSHSAGYRARVRDWFSCFDAGEMGSPFACFFPVVHSPATQMVIRRYQKEIK